MHVTWQSTIVDGVGKKSWGKILIMLKGEQEV